MLRMCEMEMWGGFGSRRLDKDQECIAKPVCLFCGCTALCNVIVSCRCLFKLVLTAVVKLIFGLILMSCYAGERVFTQHTLRIAYMNTSRTGQR